MPAGPKPPRGEFKRERAQRQASADVVERKAKLESKSRDNFHCRVPNCTNRHLTLHSAHLKHKGAGGDKLSLRSGSPDDYVSMCSQHHEEFDKAKSLVLQVLTPQRGGGLVGFYRRTATGLTLLGQTGRTQ